MKPTKRQIQIVEDFVKKTTKSMLNEVDPNFRKNADLKYSERNKFIAQKTSELFDAKYSKELMALLREVMDELRTKLSVKDISFGRDAGADIKIIRNQLKKDILIYMNNWTS